jgi:recombination protein RecA
MANQARIIAENALRARQLDRTLTTAVAPAATNSSTVASTGLTTLDRLLRGGFPHGQQSEIAGPPSAGRLTVAVQAMAGVTGQGGLAAFIDTFDRLDVTSTAAAGVVLDRLLWVRGQAITRTDAVTDLRERTIDRALKSLMLILQAGGFGLVVLDLADVPMTALRRLPAPTWLRVQRAVEGRETACVVLTPEPLARSAGGCTLALTAQTAWAGDADRSRLMTGLTLGGRVISPRRRFDGTLALGAHYLPEEYRSEKHRSEKPRSEKPRSEKPHSTHSEHSRPTVTAAAF